MKNNRELVFFHRLMYNLIGDIMIKRTLYNKMDELIKHFPAVLLTGPRQTGKSTLCYEFTKQGFSYTSLDDIRTRTSANEDPVAFINTLKLPAIIDEVQYEPRLFAVINQIINEKRLKTESANGLFILTGSQDTLLIKGIESMVGRIAVLNMATLSQSEILNVAEKPFVPSLERANQRLDNYKINRLELANKIIRGGYPELYNNPLLKTDDFFSAYLQTYIEKDFVEILGDTDKLTFIKFIRLLASETGQELNMTKIGKLLGVRLEIIKRWISALLQCKLIYLLPSYNDASIVKRIIKRPKIYFADTGFACFLAELNHPNVLMNSRFFGAFSETYMINEIIKSYINNGMIFHGYYYRDSNQNEIDLVLFNEGKMHRIEFKTGALFSKKDIKAFEHLDNVSHEKGINAIVCLTDKPYIIDKDNLVLPIQTI